MTEDDSRDPRPLSVSEFAELTGLSLSTVQRRASAWARGDHSPYGIKSGRTGGDTGDRQIDPLEADRVRLQSRGDIPPTVTADEYARQQHEP